ncbi:MAG TPA: acyl-CoA desaturase [Acidimicrobiia bacterium]|nr:acyl-CoA desaturase [Acidimicrobiia bacterium]
MSTETLEHAPDPAEQPRDPSSSESPVAAAHPELYRIVLTAIVAFGPIVVAAIVIVGMLGGSIPWFDLALLALFMVVIGHGVTVGFHRLFTHRSFVANRPLKISLALLGSMSFQGSLIGWVADHRRHHRWSDRPGDPHSPEWIGAAPVSGWRGLWHAHIGWTFRGETTSREAYAADLLADPDLVLVDRLFVPCCVLTLAVPFAIGWLWTGTAAGAISALLIAGIVRIGLTHNFTWSINSVCHRFGSRAFQTRDASTNVAVLAPFTMGESWHNNHHAFPRLARHGVDPRQFDSSAAIIRVFERFGWATEIQWPDPALLEARRLPS